MKHLSSFLFVHRTAIFLVLCFFLANVECETEEDDDGFAPIDEHNLEKHKCEDPLPPIDGELICGKNRKNINKYLCTATCDSGYKFPNGKRIQKHSCDLRSGKWSPEYEFPDCKPVCHPPCENRGECVEGNRCICTSDYRGERCQYALEMCDPNKDLAFADWECNHFHEQTVCTMKCPNGMKYEYNPAKSYHCSLDGKWTPDSAPRCLSRPWFTSNLASSDVCAVWGASHYRTFDGGIYSFQGDCTYLLSEDCTHNTFRIEIHNAESCKTATSCKTTLIIFTNSEKYLLSVDLDGAPVVYNNGEIHAIPAAVNGLLFQMLSDYITVSSSLGFRLKWNLKNTVLLKVNSQLQNRTCGLCGNFDGSVINDFRISDGRVTDSILEFVNSWQMENLQDNCEARASFQDSCSDNGDNVADAEKLCSAIFDETFSFCHQLVDPKAYFEVCKMDQCACPFQFCYCETLAEYFRECSRLGGKIEGGWRSSELCPLSCPEGMVYNDCGSSCPKTCKKTVYDCEDNHCLDGCHCPNGKVLHNGRCVQESDCPCMHTGKEYQTGDRILVDCNACECNAGKWECTKEKCEARCTSAGDPHYTTFDGISYEFLGSCPYYLVYNKDFTVIQDTGPCSDTSAFGSTTEGMFCTRSMTITYFDEVLVLEPEMKVTLNGRITDLPMTRNGIFASMVTSLFLKVSLGNGLSVLWDGQNRIYIDASPALIGQTMGLCGTFNKNQNDDFLTPNRDFEANIHTFADQWKASDACYERSRRRHRDLCEFDTKVMNKAEFMCSTLYLDIFKACHFIVDPAHHYRSCISDLCLGKQNLIDYLCPILADYSLACSKNGVIVKWTDSITECKPKCAADQVYQECGNPCTSSCAAIASSESCKEQCIQGCTCAEGMTLNSEGLCVFVDQCPCIYEGKEYLPSISIVQDYNVCTCQGARWRCSFSTFQENSASHHGITSNGHPSQNCLAQNYEEFTNCLNTCRRTCQNMHLPLKCKVMKCQPGCECKEGFVFDPEKNICVEEKECGCMHGGRRYKFGETRKQSCNLCTCVDGAWQCTEKMCSGVCSVWGASHFKTFDGKFFDFQGDCEYILSDGETADASYSLTIQNVPCGTSGITCSKSFNLYLGSTNTVEEEKLILSRGDPLPKISYNSRFIVSETGLFVTIYTDIGVSLLWDKGTQISLIVEPKWRGRIKGLCGNFNDDQTDDFLTPFDGIPEANVFIFADSWKMLESCPKTKPGRDACQIHPEKKTWAHEKCKILMSEAFSSCHSEVAVRPYFESCETDSCACDMGGDCECFCTAVAAYVQECNIHGVSIKWRSQDMCPIQCDQYTSYESCLPSCPKNTCENEFIYDKIQQACSSDICVEGCNPKPCPDGQIYNNGREHTCISLSECKIPCMELNGKLYYEGDRITDLQLVDSCQLCHCTMGNITCTDQPCNRCKETGWTPWIKSFLSENGDAEDLAQPRTKAELDEYCGIENMENIECRIANTKPYDEIGEVVHCSLPYGMSCKKEGQSNAVCQNYEFRVYCNCERTTTSGIPFSVPAANRTTTTEVPFSVSTETTVSTVSSLCVPGWTEFFNTDHPEIGDDMGDDESLERIREQHEFCVGGTIQDIECKYWVNGVMHDYKEFGTFGLKCSKDTGFICNKQLRRNNDCVDFSVRFYCACGPIPTTKPTKIPVTTPMKLPPFCKQTGWSAWMSEHLPNVNGEFEILDILRINHYFCADEEIENIECRAITTWKLVVEDEENLICNKKVGLVCQGSACEDYEVRVYCRCEEPISKKPTPGISTTTLSHTPVTTVPVECGWTPWLNMGNPDKEEGDIEDLKKMQELYNTCGGEDLADIECRMVRTQHTYSESMQENLVCDTEQGFRCYNKDQIGKCYDYEVRLLCMYPGCATVTTTEFTEITTQEPCRDGLVYDPCAFHCDHLCLSLASMHYTCTEEINGGCIAGCRPLQGCEPPKVWKDYQTCVFEEDCTCVPENKTTTSNGGNCEECKCVNDRIKCETIPGCITIPAGNQSMSSTTGITTSTITSAQTSSTQTLLCNSWSEWINDHHPNFENGKGNTDDTERSMHFTLKHKYNFCLDGYISGIECREVATGLDYKNTLDKNLVCSITSGFRCRGKDQTNNICSDYKIRYFCNCSNLVKPGLGVTPTTITTEYPSSTIVPSITPEYSSTTFVSSTTHIVTTPQIPNVQCSDEMGVRSKYIQDSQITTSSSRNRNSDARYVRLDTKETKHHTGGWVASELNDRQFVQIDLLELHNLTGVKMQGRDVVKQWVTAFTVSYSLDCKTWITISDEYGPREFRGNHDSKTTVTVFFPEMIETRCIRIHPEEWENWIAMRLELLGCLEICYQPMGIRNRLISDTSISVSSSLPNSGASRIRLNIHSENNATGGWIAADYDPKPSVFIDFTGPRHLTGIITQGLEDDDSWTTKYRVLYSLDKTTWKFARNRDGKEDFRGNSDRNSFAIGYFSEMIVARFLQITIEEYHNAPALRMEVLGCLTNVPPPFPGVTPTTITTVYPTSTVVPPTKQSCLEYGPWISLSDPATSRFGDKEPIDKIISASGVCEKPTGIECRTLATRKDYSEVGQIVTCDLTHGLICKNSLQSSYRCYNYEVRIMCLCDSCVKYGPWISLSDPAASHFGDKEPIDRIISASGECENPSGIECRSLTTHKDYTQTGQTVICDLTHGLICKNELQPSYQCYNYEVRIMCCNIGSTPSYLPPGSSTYTPRETGSTTTMLPRHCSTDFPEETDTCEIRVDIFKTFDGLSYQYDACHYVLMREKLSESYSVTIHNACSSGSSCDRYLVIEVDGIDITLGPDIEDVTVLKIPVSMENLWLVSKHFQDFELKKRGNTVLFKSTKYNFDVTWRNLQDAKITVSKCLENRIEGFCGSYNGNSNDDFRITNGILATEYQLFVENWSSGSSKCRLPICPPEIMRTAEEFCKELKKEPFNPSCSEFLDMENEVNVCAVHMCECLQKLGEEDPTSVGISYNISSINSCKCSAYESFVETCVNSRREPIKEWRILHGCAPTCPDGMEWQECGPGCEVTCDNYHQREQICTEQCVPGCYCPPGLVRHRNRCISPPMCQDCICRGEGDPNYITFDGQYYSFQGTCTYTLVQHQTSKFEAMNFRILVTNVECPDESQTSCSQGLTIYWKNYVIKKFKNEEVYLNDIALSPEASPSDNEEISIIFVPNKNTVIHIKEINLVVRYFDQMYGFSVQLPSYFYFNKTEGLCGVCNFIESDDLYLRDGYITTDIEEFAYSWLEEGKIRKECEIPIIKPPLPLPPDTCNFTSNACEIFLDSTPYIKSCQNDVRYSENPQVSECRSKFHYAQQCCERGISLGEWLKLSGCESSCPKGMLYECTSACQKTCNNYKTYQDDACNLRPLYQCVCPKGEVLKLNKCVQTVRCEVSIRNKTQCGLIPPTQCDDTICPQPVCKKDEELRKINKFSDDCCGYECIPRNCPRIQLETCPLGQSYVKDYEDGCPIYRCECVTDMCPPPEMPQLDDGEDAVWVNESCCMVFRIVCRNDSCAPPPICKTGYELSINAGKCCEKYTCVLKKDVCFYQYQVGAIDGIQMDLGPENFYGKVYQVGDVWPSPDGDPCKSYRCDLDQNNRVITSMEKILCETDCPEYAEYVKLMNQSNKCCGVCRPFACEDDGIIYEVGKEWRSPDDDPCKSYQCVLNKKDEAIISEKTIACDTSCPKNAMYIEPLDESGKCCGACKFIACEEDGIVHQVGKTWTPATNSCFIAECTETKSGTQIIYRSRKCPIMPENCAPEYVKTDSEGCCTYCEKPPETCSTVEVPAEETRGFFKFTDAEGSFCSNKEILHNLRKCSGQCSLDIVYTDRFKNDCRCCLPQKFEKRSISLQCDLGYEMEIDYEEPITCHCSSCSENCDRIVGSVISQKK